jgi:hypothetical protein
MHSAVKISIRILINKNRKMHWLWHYQKHKIKISQIYTRKKIPISLSKIGKILLGNKTLAIKKAPVMHVVTWHGDGHPCNILPWTCISTLNCYGQ